MLVSSMGWDDDEGMGRRRRNPADSVAEVMTASLKDSHIVSRSTVSAFRWAVAVNVRSTSVGNVLQSVCCVPIVPSRSDVAA